MSHPLDGPLLKIRRAQLQIQLLADLEEAWGENAEYRIVRAEINPQTGNQVLRAQVGKKPPLEWGVLIGEIAHNLRSALDGLVYQLALRDSRVNTLTWRTQFPIFTKGRTKIAKIKAKKGKRDLVSHFEIQGRAMMKGVSKKHQAMIERLQPYKRRSRRSDPLYGMRHSIRHSPLSLIQEINNVDKHRTIQVVVPTTGAFIARTDAVSSFKYSPVRILNDGAKLGEIPPDMTMDSKMLPLVAFWDCPKPLRGMAVCLTLAEISKYISLIIIKSFWSELLPPP
jgi:hypothetical protein